MKDIMKYKGFIGSVHFAAEDRAFYGKMEGVNDCNKNNIPVEKSYKGNLNIRLSPEIHKKAAYNASIRGLSLNQ
jgi:predicted HicB family RNase H-like nuclease